MSKAAIILLFIGCFFYSVPLNAQPLTDPRDGQVYPTLTIRNPNGGIITIMSKNLNYITQGSIAYDYNESNREKYGLLYNWNTAQQVCPDGWHLPTINEWKIIINNFGGEEIAGKQLKSNSGWWNSYDEEDGSGTNLSGFNAKAGGYFHQRKFYHESFMSLWWTSTSKGSNEAVYITMYSFSDKVGNLARPKHETSKYVRCVK